MGGLSGLYQRSARDFVRTLPGQMAELQRALASNPAHARMLAHTLKGTASLLGAMALSDAASALEKQCLTGSPSSGLLAAGQALELLSVASSTQLQAALALLEAREPAADRGQATVRVAPVTAPASAPQTSPLQQGLAELMQLLSADDVRALEKYAELAPALHGVPDDLLAPLEEALQDLELEQGLQACGAITAWLEGVSA
jgi:HPt (histidine-containing phosphotransfer) domain-containing protein